jgi:hypothetical protein
MSEFGTYSHPVGRKDYRCEWCGQPIPKGEQHAHYVGLWEGEFQNWRVHQECMEALQLDNQDQDGFSPFENERPVVSR